MKLVPQIIFSRVLFLAALWGVLLLPRLSYAQEGSQGFPDGITPSHVYAAVDLVSRSVDVLLESRKLKAPPTSKCIESNLGPFHIYQLQLACIGSLHAIQKKQGMRPIPLVVTTPMKYAPADCKKLPDMMLPEVRKLAAKWGVQGLPQNIISVSGKTTTDVFGVSQNLFTKLRVLSGQSKIAPSEVYAQMVRAVADSVSILEQVDPSSRYRVDSPTTEPSRTPRDVFVQCLQVRHEINHLRKWLGISESPVPTIEPGKKISPADVFLQSQIIIAELNLLKMHTNTIRSTPLAIPVSHKTPTDVHRQATMLKYLLPQIRRLQELLAQTK